jgi:hypothetical protein
VDGADEIETRDFLLETCQAGGDPAFGALRLGGVHKTYQNRSIKKHIARNS